VPEEEEKVEEVKGQEKNLDENGVYNFASKIIPEETPEKEEQGSSGTNPLSTKNQNFQPEYDADLD
jgi:hypothetical protein